MKNSKQTSANVARQIDHQVFCSKTAGNDSDRCAALIGRTFGYHRQLEWAEQGCKADYDLWHTATLKGLTTSADRRAAIKSWLESR
tara:strand:+ start:4349 stop:4606 length:258 start_codon:yes stop_codon:yes gene_type:complete